MAADSGCRRHCQLIQSQSRAISTVACKIRHRSFGGDVRNTGIGRYQPVARIRDQIALGRAGAANGHAAVPEATDGCDFQSGRGRDTTIGQKERKRNLFRCARHDAAGCQLHHIHCIASVISSRGGDSLWITLGVQHHWIDRDDMAIAVVRQRHAGDTQYVATGNGTDEAGIFGCVCRREHLDEG